MKVFVLGGYGKVGLPAITLLAQSDLVTEIAIVGRSLEKAEKAATEIGDKAIAVQADGTDEKKLTSLLAGYDIIVNAADNEFVLPSIRAAIHNGCYYCDVAFGVVLEQALQLSSEVESVEITAIVANGVAPGISNLMGVHVARQLDEVDQLLIGFADIYNFQSGRELTPRQWLKDPKESLAELHECRSFIAWILQMVQENGIRTVLDFQDGRWEEMNPLRSGLDVPLQQGGTIKAYPYASIDPLIGGLPRDLSTVSPAEVYFNPLPPQLHKLLRDLALEVLEGNLSSDIAMNTFYDTVESDLNRWLKLPEGFVPLPKMWVRAMGRKSGRAARCSCWFTATMWNVGGWFLTSVALVVAVRKVLRGEIRERGVMTAEKAFEPMSFFDEVVAVLPEPPPNGRLLGESFEWLQ